MKMIRKKVLIEDEMYKYEDSFFNPSHAKGASMYLEDMGKKAKIKKNIGTGKYMLFSR